MTQGRPWVRGELPWIQSGPLCRVHSDAWPALDSYLTSWAYGRIELDGRKMTSRSGAHAELQHAFGFPDYYGRNWDAFNDSLRDFVEEHHGALVAVIWRYFEVAANAAPATTTEVGWALLNIADGGMPTMAPGETSSVDLDIFVIGEGPDFDHPTVR